MEEAKFLINQAVLQKVVDYLATRPFSEVSDLVAAVQQSAVVYEEPKAGEAVKQVKK